MADLASINCTGVATLQTAPTSPQGAARRAEIDVATGAPVVLANVNSFVGGDVQSLDGCQASAGLTLGTRFQFTEAATGARRVVRIVFSTAASAPPLITVPTDFDPSNNPRVYILESPVPGAVSDDIPEGETNLYFTPERAAAAAIGGVSTPAAAAAVALSTLKGLQGGGATNLDGIPVATGASALPTYYTMIVVTFTGAVIVRLELNTDLPNGAQSITPPDDTARSWRVRG